MNKRLIIGGLIVYLIATFVFLISKIPQPKEPQKPKTTQGVIPKPQITYETTPTLQPISTDDLHRFTNEERIKAGVKPLTLDERLNQSAQMKADEIEKTGVFEHKGSSGKNGWEYINYKELGCTYVGENLASDTTATGTINDWMTSKNGHREALLHIRYNLVGYAVSKGPGYYYIVQHFCDL